MSIPCWRYVRYTDDGSALYQCLNCYEQWDARTAPGWHNKLVETEVAVKGGMTITRGDGTAVHYADREEPEYIVQWKFCPCCGIRWDGPVPHDCSDNEHMLGDHRLQILRAIRRRQEAESDARWKMPWGDRDKVWDDVWRAPPAFWWVIQECSEYSDWQDKEYAYGGLMPAKKMLYFLREHQKLREEENREQRMRGWDNRDQVRLIVRRGALPKPKGYEIQNYDPI